MKQLKQFCAAVLLTLMFALSAFAGDIWAPGVTSQSSQPSASGEMSTPGATTSIDPLMALALSLLQNALSLF
ncbi:MAG: hypothetical protein H0W99_16620 [Acidobacteria bacterium]|nr:hypothetical protein [Acidobacteriota bacterium]